MARGTRLVSSVGFQQRHDNQSLAARPRGVKLPGNLTEFTPEKWMGKEGRRILCLSTIGCWKVTFQGRFLFNFGKVVVSGWYLSVCLENIGPQDVVNNHGDWFRPPNWGYGTPSIHGRTSWLIHGGDPNCLLTGMILQVKVKNKTSSYMANV